MKSDDLNFNDLGISQPEPSPLEGNSLADVFEENFERYREQLGELEATEAQTAELLSSLWEIACTASRFHRGEDLTQILFASILEKAWQESVERATNDEPNSNSEESEDNE